VAGLIVLLGLAPLEGQDMPVPPEQQLVLFPKILEFDRNLQSRAGDEIVIGILYQRNFRDSRNARNDLLSAAEQQSLTTIAGIPVRFVSIDSDEQPLASAVETEQLDLLYVSPLRAFDLQQISALSRQHAFVTLTGVPDYVAEVGIAIGIGSRGGRPEIVINLPACEAGGVDFHSQLLQLARVIS
jgi:hypothetical protein